MKKIAINGLGRVGRLLPRRFMQGAYRQFSLVAVNLAYLLKYDSVHGRSGLDVSLKDNKLLLNGTAFHLSQEKDTENLPWKTLAPALKALHDYFVVETATVTTIHAYTSSQSLVDVPTKKNIRGRAGAVNIIPTATGADAATVQVMPEMKDRLNALAVRVPVADGSLTDISAVISKPADVADINNAFKAAADNALKGILAFSDDELVSSDIIGNPHSTIIHGRSTRVVGNRHIKVQTWYDNEYGYACRCLDLLEKLPV